MQRSLFDDGAERAEIPAIPGLVYRADYLLPEQERELLARIDAEPWRSDWQRRTQHYGTSYPSREARRRPPVVLGAIPSWLAWLGERLAADGLVERVPENVVVNEYLPGQGIAPHKDLADFGPTVVSVSLGAPVVMRLAHESGAPAHELLLAPRSALAIGGEARAAWLHGIARRKSDRWQGRGLPRARRVSVTFRTVRRRRP
ncbi:MAG: alpha-ketoglutarate-dependent dioxygenase AlkB [Acidobacteria bacterium]|nr:alpha-ketoglutarate-dependent dioxygenase AlkB [Acidobacteriota bacterium]